MESPQCFVVLLDNCVVMQHKNESTMQPEFKPVHQVFSNNSDGKPLILCNPFFINMTLALLLGRQYFILEKGEKTS